MEHTQEKTKQPSNIKNNQPFFSPAPTIQAKLKIGSPNDKYEQQADRVADAVVNTHAPTIQMQSLDEEMLQMKCNDCDEESLQMKEDTTQKGGVAPDHISQQIQNTTGGSTLPEKVNREMSQKIGADFSGVNIHTDSNASSLSHDLGAKAFTVGNNIFFNQGHYDPHSRKGKRLLAHELVHTLQQRGDVDSKSFIQKQEESANTHDTNVKVYFNAFIPGSLGTWLDEPGTPHCDFKTDKRSFGEAGISRISHYGEFKINANRGISNCITNSDVGTSHRRCFKYLPPVIEFNSSNMRLEYYPSRPSYDYSAETSTDKGSTSSDCSDSNLVSFHFVGKAAYPYLPSPNIDFDVLVNVAQNRNYFVVYAVGERNMFPAYELLVEFNGVRNILYKYMPTDKGPGLINLNRSHPIRTNPGIFSL